MPTFAARYARPLLVFLVASLQIIAWTGTANALELRRGVGIHHMLNWAATTKPYQGKPLDAPYAFPPFAESKYQIDDQFVKAIASAGFDFVRLTVDPGPFLFFRGEQRAALDRILVDRVSRFRDAGLSVVVDFHPNSQQATYNPAAYEDRSGLFDDYVKMIGRTAGVLAKNFSDGVAIEPFNEPQTGYHGWENGLWDRMQKKLVKAVRAESRTLPVIVTGGQGGSIDGLLALDPRPYADDPQVFFSFHYYLPYEFTHQTTQWGRPEWRYIDHVPYPSDPQRLAAVLAAAKTRIDKEAPAADRATLKDKLEQAFAAYPQAATPERIHDDFGKVTGWAAKYGIPNARVVLGEFGSTGNGRTGKDLVNTEDRLRWLADIRRAAEADTFAWSLWVLKDDGFGLEDPKTNNTLDARQLEALGLSVPGK